MSEGGDWRLEVTECGRPCWLSQVLCHAALAAPSWAWGRALPLADLHLGLRLGWHGEEPLPADEVIE